MKRIGQVQCLFWLFLIGMMSIVGQASANPKYRPLDLNADTTALLAFAQNITGLNWASNVPLNNWQGVIFNADSCVIALDLSGLGLSGTLPTAAPQPAGALNCLKRIDLSNNNLTGDLATTGPFFGGLDSLRYLNLNQNNFSGAVPNELTTLNLLDTLDVGFNRLDSLPDFSGTRLRVLAVDSNSLTFGSLEPNANLPNFTYQDQDSIQAALVIEVFEGQNFSYTISTSGRSDEYLWFENGNRVATTATISVPNVSLADSGRIFIAHVINSIITDLTLFRRPVTIKVLACPRQNRISGDTTICSNDPTVIPISERALNLGDATGAQFSWIVSSDSLNFVPLTEGNAPVTTRNYSRNNFTETLFYRRLLSTDQCPADTSNTVKINVLPTVTNNVSPTVQTVCPGQRPDTLLASIPDTSNVRFTITWQISLDQSNWQDTTGLDDQTLLLDTLTDTTYVRRIVLGGCTPDTSAVVRINLQPRLDSNLIFRNQVVCQNALPARLTGTRPVGGTGTYTYSWQVRDTVINNAPVWVEVGTNTFYQPDSIGTDTLFFRRVVRSGCDSLVSNIVRLLPAQDLGQNTISADYTTVCRGSALPLFQGNAPAADPTTFIYLWQTTFDLNEWTTQDSSQNYDAPDSLFTESFFVRRIITDSCQNYFSNVLRITVVDSLRNNVISASNRQICAGDTTPVISLEATSPRGGAGNYAYQWQISLDSGRSWADRDTSALVAQAAPLSQTAQFRRIVLDSCFSDTSNIVEINVLQFFGENTISVNDPRICFGDSGISIVGSPPTARQTAFTYRWQSSTDSVLWFGIFTDTSVQSLEVDSFFLPETRYFRRIVRGGCRPDTSNVVRIEVIPTPQNNVITGNQTVCEGALIAPLSGALPTGAPDSVFRVEWQASTDSVDWLPVGDSLRGLSGISLGDTTLFRRVLRLSDFCPPSVSNIVRVNVIKALTNNRIRDDQSICLGDSAALMEGPFPNGSDTLPTFRWQALPFGDTVWQTVSSLQNFRPVLPRITTQYRRIVQTVCRNDTSNLVTIRVSLPVRANVITAEQVICKGEAIDTLRGVDLADSLNFPPPFSYQWQVSGDRLSWQDLPNGETVNYLPSPQDSTVYFRRLVRTDCQTDSSNVLMIRALPLPVVDAGQDTSVFIGESVRLQATGAVTYVWRPGQTLDDDSIANPLATPRFTTDYIVAGTDRNGCTNRDTVQVRVVDQPQVRAVDAITPNGDGLNEFFVIENIENYPNSTLIIFDRRGKQILQRQGYQNNWDGSYNGTRLPAGVYYYLIKFDISRRTVKGSFMILD